MRAPVRGTAALLGVLLTGLLPACSPPTGPPTAVSMTPSTSPSTPSSPRPSTQPSPAPTTPAPTTPVPSSSPPTAAPGSVAPVDARVDAVLAGMDERARVAQLFLVGVPATDLAAGDALARAGVGGLFLAGRSTAAATALGATTARWAAEAPGPRPWVAADQEGGLVQTLSGPGFAELPTATAQGALPAGRLAALADGLGASLRTAGVTLDLAPVVDVVPAGTERANAPIGAVSRQYGSTPEDVGAAAGTVVTGLAAAGVHATLKHFPGLGRVTGNTDTTAGVTDPTTTADDPQVALFGALARTPAAPFVMVSLAVYPRIDGTQPAAFSPAVVTTLLRGRLGCSGVVVSDDLGKSAAVAAVAPGERAVRFLAAGGTLVLTVVPAVLPAMEAAVRARASADPRFAALVDTATRTALLAKARAGLLPG